ncbi:hypothetical protein, partial [Bartonella sp. OT172YNZD]|uniref:hypothetical protein n=1 Tax=Bartonella sp. OT172YNZD TaxID=3243572 RepID=UPI0035D0C0DD
MEIQQQFLGIHNDRHRLARTGQLQTVKNPENTELFKLCHIKHMTVRFKLMAERKRALYLYIINRLYISSGVLIPLILLTYFPPIPN